MLINPYEFATGGGGGGGSDPFFANVSLLMHMDALAGGTPIDSSGNGIIFSHNTTIIQDSTHQLAGAACMEFASVSGGTSFGNDLSTSIATSGPLDLSTGDYTIEGWLNPNTNSPSGGTNVAMLTSGLSSLLLTISTASTISGTIDGSSVSGPVGALTAGSWHHVAVTMQSNTVTISVDGVAGTPVAVSRSSWTSQVLWIGGSQFGVSYAGLIDEFRITKGVARYTSFPFTPPATPFPDM